MRPTIEMFDLHVPFNISLAGIEDYGRDLNEDFGKVDRVYGGDQMDLDCISHWTKSKLRLLEGKRLKKDYEQMNKILDRHDKIFTGDTEYMIGNHEVWIEQLIDEIPALEGLFEMEKMLHLKDRGYNIVKENGFARKGKLYYIHGLHTNIHHAKKTVERIGRSVVYGHIHQRQEFTINSAIDSDDCHRGISMPCLYDYKKYAKYLRNRPTNWSHGFGVTYTNEKGFFQHNTIDIVGGRFIGLNGKEYKA